MINAESPIERLGLFEVGWKREDVLCKNCDSRQNTLSDAPEHRLT